MSSKDKKYNIPDDSELDFYDPERDGPADDGGFDEDEPEESHEGVREENTADGAEADDCGDRRAGKVSDPPLSA